MLDIQVRKRLGEFTLEAELSLPPRSVLVLVGESGAGKTTLLRLIAGLIEPDAGRIALDGTAYTDRARGTLVPARLRPVGYVAQDYALFPHLDAYENVAFGLRATGARGGELHARSLGALDRLGIAELRDRLPQALSGGQQQRVALARALVLEPRILLLDEPLAALDLQTRRAIRSELKGLLEALECVTILVTHSPPEALAFGENIAVLESGRITQQGVREDLLLKPRTRYVADFLGTNLFRARVVRRDASGLTHLGTEAGEIAVSECAFEGEVFAVVDPRKVSLAREPAAGSAQNVLRGPIVELLPEPPAGDRIRVSLGTHPPLVAELTRAAAQQLALAPGVSVAATFKATGVRVFQ